MQIEGRNFLITGGASLIGSHITKRLIEQGAARIVLFDNFSLGQQSLAESLSSLKGVEVVRGDILRLPSMVDAMADIHGVFALAAYLTLPLSSAPAVGVEVNSVGVVNVLEAARLAKVARVVFASSIAVYGDNTEGVVDESRPFRSSGLPAAFATYGSTKLLAEHLSRLYAAQHGLHVASARFSTVYGENQHARGVNALYILEAMQAISRGQAPTLAGDGEEVHDYIHASDAAQGCLDIMCKSVSGESYNIASGVASSVNDVLRLVLAEYRSDLKPARAEDKRATKGTSHTHLDISTEKARTRLGWEPKVTLGDGIHRLRKWMDESAR